MKKIALLAMVALPALATDIETRDNPDGSRTFTLTKEQAQSCDSQGGCMVAPLELLREAVRRSAAKMCGKDV